MLNLSEEQQKALMETVNSRNQISEVKVAPSYPPFKIYYTDREIRI